MFTYDHNKKFLQDFYENWRPSTNTISTFVGELSISLWDLRTIGGHPVHGFFYDEFIPLAKELTHKADCVRASVFKGASLLAHGEKFSLAVPTLKAANTTDFEVIDTTLKRKKPSSSSDTSVEKSLGIAPFCSNTSKASILLHEIDSNTSVASRSNMSNVNQEQHRKCLNKTPKDLNSQHSEFAELDAISIDTVIFEDGAADSIMPLSELTHQVKVISCIFL
ncbi:hypothetical protein H5410_056932 [Solanum commersonii]|uniref:Aminotransferase-like plant mobile domain-containing protein n=1 Tax=Solanum commersonii TaxID=4109 RepID=A0A9J5WPG7_SOLCO|nr:hypothetical protein H5410_056932 [Solanum commersonii]